MRKPFIHRFIRYIIQRERLSIENDAIRLLEMVLEALEGISVSSRNIVIGNDTLILMIVASNAIQQLWANHKCE
jgi:hypothetical protein